MKPVALPALPDGFADPVLIGRGGFSTVWRAYQEQFDREVAIKLLVVDDLDDEVLRRFQRECAAMGRLSYHPHVITVHESGVTSDGHLYVVTELCSGGSYWDQIKMHGPLPVATVRHVAARMAAALTAAHEAGMIHRDVKPANILITSYGEPVLADFGLSVRPDIDATKGADAYTPGHAAPETLDDGVATPASDIYSLASTLYSLLDGRPPFPLQPGESLLRHAVRVMRDDPPPLERAVPNDLKAFVEGGLSKDPRIRPPLSSLLDAPNAAVEEIAAVVPPKGTETSPEPDEDPTIERTTSSGHKKAPDAGPATPAPGPSGQPMLRAFVVPKAPHGT
jgi:serine/threonine-protein kinase PknK